MTQIAVPVPAPMSPGDIASVELRQCLLGVLGQIVREPPHVMAQVLSPYLLDGVVTARNPRSDEGSVTGPPQAVFQRRVPLPAAQHVPSGEFVLSATSSGVLAAAPAFAALIVTIIDKEIARLAAEAAARGALLTANRDPATGLGNRRAWVGALQVEMSRAKRSGTPLTVLILDIDGLKAVNDTHGHAAGDEVIARTAAALGQARRVTDQVCRLGGDEFGVAAPETRPDQAALLATRLRQSLTAHQVRASLGWAVASHGLVDAGLDAAIDALWHEADAALYGDKRRRRG